MGMKSYKAALQPNGFQPAFYKMFWDKIGDDVRHFVKDVFESSIFDLQAAETMIV